VVIVVMMVVMMVVVMIGRQSDGSTDNDNAFYNY
jgi:hypothetical protein